MVMTSTPAAISRRRGSGAARRPGAAFRQRRRAAADISLQFEQPPGVSGERLVDRIEDAVDADLHRATYQRRIGKEAAGRDPEMRAENVAKAPLAEAAA